MGVIKKINKQVTVGKREFIDSETGEIQELTVISKPVDRDVNFHKIWLADILSVLDSFGTARLKVLTHLLKKMRVEDNSISGSYRELAKEIGISYPTVAVTMKELIDADVIKKTSLATYQINPNIIAKGSSSKRMNLLIQYRYTDDMKPDPVRKVKDIDAITSKLVGIDETQTEIPFIAVAKEDK